MDAERGLPRTEPGGRGDGRAWVDGKYVGEARDVDGYPSYLWLADGDTRSRRSTTISKRRHGIVKTR
jgi:hypothetical protein